MHEQTHESIPTKIRAVQIPGDVGALFDRVQSVFGVSAHTYLGISVVPPIGLRVTMMTAQGQYVSAGPGEWVVQESPDPTRFYPVDADVFAARYRSL